MKCQNCQENPARVRITELAEPPTTSPVGNGVYTERYVCEVCAGKLNMPHVPVVKKLQVDIWKLLQSARSSRGKGDLVCEQCGMNQSEFQGKGRLGCPACYETFSDTLDPLLLRMHNARSHVGRLPGLDEEQLAEREHRSDLEAKLETAIREEDYESAARLRDELRSLGTA
jgi:protein arginine kinase activator